MSWFKKVKEMGMKVKDAAVRFDEAYCNKCAQIEEKIFKKPADEKIEEVATKVVKFAKTRVIKPSTGLKPVDANDSSVTIHQSDKEAVVKDGGAEVEANSDKKDIYRHIGVGLVSGIVTATVGWQYGLVLATSWSIGWSIHKYRYGKLCRELDANDQEIRQSNQALQENLKNMVAELKKHPALRKELEEKGF